MVVTRKECGQSSPRQLNLNPEKVANPLPSHSSFRPPDTSSSAVTEPFSLQGFALSENSPEAFRAALSVAGGLRLLYLAGSAPR